MLRVAVGKFWHESNTFTAVETEAADLYRETAYSHVKVGSCVPL